MRRIENSVPSLVPRVGQWLKGMFDPLEHSLYSVSFGG